jgi:hypothetical protein
VDDKVICSFLIHYRYVKSRENAVYGLVQLSGEPVLSVQAETFELGVPEQVETFELGVPDNSFFIINFLKRAIIGEL